MNFEKVQRKNRKAISPVLATVILIAITLIAAIAIAGFVFGLFGTFTSTARVDVTAVTCLENVAGTTVTCTAALSNSGNAPSSWTACSITANGVVRAGTIGGTVPPVNAGATVTGVTCANTAVFPAAVPTGSQITGSFALSNGGQALFTGLVTT